MRKIIRILLAALAAGITTGAAAQDYPSRPVRLIVPFPAGAATDLAARIVGQQLQQLTGQAFVVENKPGANGSIAGMEVVRAPADGYTLLFSSNSAIAANVALLKSMPYDPLKELTPVAGVGENPLVLMVRSDSPANSLKEFVDMARRQPGKLSSGFGSSSSQVCAAMLNRLASLDTLPVPYKGIPLALADVIGGTVDFAFADMGNAMAQAKGGRLKALAVTTAKRSPVMPDWPAIAETYPGYSIKGWFGIVGPAGLPKVVVDKLSAETLKAVNGREVADRFATLGIAPMPMNSAQLRDYMVSEVANWKRLVAEASVQPE
jgi:tripartite-type tricarboxylate transporter receptor subunit TctC